MPTGPNHKITVTCTVLAIHRLRHALRDVSVSLNALQLSGGPNISNKHIELRNPAGRRMNGHKGETDETAAPWKFLLRVVRPRFKAPRAVFTSATLAVQTAAQTKTARHACTTVHNRSASSVK